MQSACVTQFTPVKPLDFFFLFSCSLTPVLVAQLLLHTENDEFDPLWEFEQLHGEDVDEDQKMPMPVRQIALAMQVVDVVVLSGARGHLLACFCRGHAPLWCLRRAVVGTHFCANCGPPAGCQCLCRICKVNAVRVKASTRVRVARGR